MLTIKPEDYVVIRLCDIECYKDMHLTCFIDIQKELFTDEAYRILDNALSKPENKTISERVRKVTMQVNALECTRHHKEFYKSGRWPEFTSQVLKYGAYYDSHISTDSFINSFEAKVKR